MAGKYLLDSNVAISFLEKELAFEDVVAGSDELFLASIVVGELYYGAIASHRSEENLQRLEAFVTAIAMLSCDLDTAVVYGELKANLRSKGRPIPDNDLWIAAIAKQHGLTLVTRDKHFSELEGLDLKSW